MGSLNCQDFSFQELRYMFLNFEPFSLSDSNKMLVFRAEIYKIYKMLVREDTDQTASS